MDLQDWFDKTDISYRDFAKKSGISITSLFLYRTKQRRPSFRVAVIIRRFTKNEVALKDLGWELNE